MTAFKGLLKKDFHISKFGFFTWLVVMILIMIASVLISNRIGEPMVIIGMIIMLMVCHIAFVPVSLLNSLRLEGKTQIWLYSPQSSWFLILSKLTVSLLNQFLSLGLLVIYSLYMIRYIKLDAPNEMIHAILLANISIILFGLYFSCWILFYWSVYHSLGKYPSIKKFRWIAILLIFFSCNTIENLILKIKWIMNWISAWKLPLPLDQSFHYAHREWNAKIEMVDVAIIPIIIYAIIGIILFILSSWLLDRKVEV